MAKQVSVKLAEYNLHRIPHRRGVFRRLTSITKEDCSKLTGFSTHRPEIGDSSLGVDGVFKDFLGVASEPSAYPIFRP
jgi:hypothetical protein